MDGLSKSGTSKVNIALPPPLPKVYDTEIQELIFLLKITLCFLAGFTGVVFAEMLL